MTHRPVRRRAAAGGGVLAASAALAVAALAAPGFAAPATAAPTTDDGSQTPIQLERLDRGVVAVAGAEGVTLTWRLLADEVTEASATSLTGPLFVVERDGVEIARTTATNAADPDGTPESTYVVRTVVDGREVGASTVVPWAQDHLDIPLNKPAGGVTPAGEAYTYSANDVSVADLDGDGSYEYVVKWDPSNSKDVSQVGYTGSTYLDAYTLEGRQLWRIDLGVNIRSGAHYTQFPVMDFDGDGAAELMVKTAPGTSITRYDETGAVVSSSTITMPAQDVAAGYSHDDDYRLSAGDYYEHLVTVFRGWSERDEVVSGQWPATLEEAFGIEPTHSYPLSDADARELVDYFMDVYAPARSSRNALRAFEGFIVDGPEYLTVVSGDGRELQTIHYKPERGDDGLLWGDYAMARIEPGNRVDRFLAGAAYLDGEHPSAVFARGYYTRTTLVAYDWDGEQLVERWYVDSGHAPLTNPFNDGPHGRDGTDPVYGTITTQGFHSLSFADVDGDGRHEVVYGSATLDDDGSLLYSSFDVMPEESADPGTLTRLGHGDAMHVTDIDPDRPGLEIFTVHEGGTWAPYGYALRDAATGEVIHGEYSGRDTGRGMIGDVLPGVRGMEMWASMPAGSDASGILGVDGTRLAATSPGTNMSVRWSGDGTTQIVNGAIDSSGNPVTPTIDDWTRGTLRTLSGTATNNGTKGNPGLVADVIGDWREEVLVRTLDSTALRIFTSTEPTERTMYTLMHDPQYRVETARQQTTYNQPAYPGFYLASDTDFTQVPVPSSTDQAALEVELSAVGEPEVVRRGETVEILATVRNVGSVPLTDPVVDVIDDDAVPACDATEIDPGDAATCTVLSRVVTDEDVAAGSIEITVSGWAAAPVGVAAADSARASIVLAVAPAETASPTPTPTPSEPVSPGPSETVTTPAPSPSSSSTSDGSLSDTGADVLRTALAALALLGAGAAGLAWRRRTAG
ncbi:MAG: rhamnogalacturonan lyase [Salana multivorans]|uniref:rhamnogalacturonan lyase n=1 Tax=Salana multivorans TaxID=120377 RepID=UPI000B21B372|nr:rhamnogalacturonan lyase [Salana multivorans]